MKKPVSFKTLLFLCLFFLAAMAFSAGTLHATSCEITGIASHGDLKVRCEGPARFGQGDTVEISYMAGVIEMLIGAYRVTEINGGGEIALKPVSVNIPPSKGMRVLINSAPAPVILPAQK